MKDRKRETFVYHGLGFPITLVNVPMKKMLGEWFIDINMNKLMLFALKFLAYKPARLTRQELRFIRTFFQMSTTEFARKLGISHAAVVKWEKGQRVISRPLEFCIRVQILLYLEAKDKEFHELCKQIQLEDLSKSSSKKIVPLKVDASTEDLKIAL